ncbi:RNA polymerase sigma factor [Paenibacillus sp. GCM10027626]|uniref:RNA polymerase sigma factor n=1 Tax=Paenibacillus sp. GCM10027626 TaxID=3273411 RepID=UPI00362AE637
MSGAQDSKASAYPEKQGKEDTFEAIFRQYYDRIYKYFSFKVDLTAAEDLTQQVFMKALRSIHAFKQESSVFTWLYKIAQNTLKNEYRSLSRRIRTSSNLTDFESRLISLDFTKHVEIRFDISSALKKLSPLDQQIIFLRFFMDCTLLEIAEITEMRQSAVKNRLYRTLEKLRNELKEWGEITVMTIQNMISIISKDESGESKKGAGGNSRNQVHEDLFNELKGSVDQLLAKYKHTPDKKIILEIYPDLPTFHRAVGEEDAPNWFMGTYSGSTLKIVSPLDPGPEHTYRSILRSTVHLFAMWLVHEINPAAPKWIRQGIGGYEAGFMTPSYIEDSIRDLVLQDSIPLLQEFNNDSWDFETMKGFQFSYKMVEFIISKYGLDRLNQIIRNPADFQGVFHCSEAELHEKWSQYLKNQIQPA